MNHSTLINRSSATGAQATFPDGQASPASSQRDTRKEGHSRQHQPQLLDVEDVADILGVGRSFVYSECEKGAIRSLRMGRRVKVPSEAVNEYIDRGLAARARDLRQWQRVEGRS